MKRAFFVVVVVTVLFLVLGLASERDWCWEPSRKEMHTDGGPWGAGDNSHRCSRSQEVGAVLTSLIVLCIQMRTSSRNTVLLLANESHYSTKRTNEFKSQNVNWTSMNNGANFNTQENCTKRCHDVISNREASLCWWDFLLDGADRSSPAMPRASETWGKRDRVYSILY